MMHTVVSNPDVEATFRKMGKKDITRFEQLVKKLQEPAENPEMGKPLKCPLLGFRRLHIGHHVLLYKIGKKINQITLVNYAHHDDVY